MRCTNCGAEIAPGAQFCQVCGSTAVQTQTNPTYQQPYQNNPYGQPAQQSQFANQPMAQGQVSYEDAGWGLKILSLLIPIVGLIMYFINKNNAPVKAKSCIIFAAIGFGLSFIGYSL